MTEPYTFGKLFRRKLHSLGKNWFWILLIVAAIALAVVMIAMSASRPLSAFETALWQTLSLAAGLYASYRFGQNAAREAAQDVIKPHARSALRRILSLRDSLFRLSERIEEYKSVSDDPRMEVIQAIIHEQIPAGGSAVEDWRDIVPEDVEEILEQWPKRWGFEGDDSAQH